ncbi:MAG: RND transporter [Desulfobulbaceae bacterium]|nr:RND transporter [Desulfobulbaceae bacterium]
MHFIKLIDQVPWSIVIILCLSLGLAPFAPPHIWEKIQMLIKGELSRPIDWFDLVYHSIPWILLILKSLTLLLPKN